MTPRKPDATERTAYRWADGRPKGCGRQDLIDFALGVAAAAAVALCFAVMWGVRG